MLCKRYITQRCCSSHGHNEINNMISLPQPLFTLLFSGALSVRSQDAIDSSQLQHCAGRIEICQLQQSAIVTRLRLLRTGRKISESTKHGLLGVQEKRWPPVRRVDLRTHQTTEQLFDGLQNPDRISCIKLHQAPYRSQKCLASSHASVVTIAS